MKKTMGFTLIELLVVVAIIAVLISILLPGLQQARSYALQAACGSNMKQVGTAMAMYTGENNEIFPYDVIAGNDPRLNGYTRCYWQQLLMTYLGGQMKSVVDPRYSLTDVVEYLKNRPASEGGPVPDATEESLVANNYYHCFSSGPYPHFGYNHLGLGCGGFDNYFAGAGLGLSSGPGNGSRYVQMSVSGVNDPSRRIMCLDYGVSYGNGLWRLIGDVHWQMAIYQPERIRHRGGVNISFVDGHVEWDEVSPDSKYMGVNSNQYWVGEEGSPVRSRDGSIVAVIK